jgi:hypothetical protein
MVQPLLALALPDPNGTTGGSAIGNYKFAESTDVDAILQTILQYFLGIVIVTAVFFIIKAGFTFVTAGGDAEKIKHGAEQYYVCRDRRGYRFGGDGNSESCDRRDKITAYLETIK